MSFCIWQFSADMGWESFLKHAWEIGRGIALQGIGCDGRTNKASKMELSIFEHSLITSNKPTWCFMNVHFLYTWSFSLWWHHGCTSYVLITYPLKILDSCLSSHVAEHGLSWILQIIYIFQNKKIKYKKKKNRAPVKED